MTSRTWISFLTDYGDGDGFVAACRGVIARLAPEARVLDVTHGVPPQDVRRGATVLAQTVPYLPPGVHLAVVDPGVGTSRRGVAVVAGDSVFVGPDNGLLLPGADALGGPVAAVELTDPAYRLAEVSATFHGRDIFAPAAAHLATGLDPRRLGPAVDPAGLVRLPAAVTRVTPAGVDTEVIGVDRFGNVQLDATAADLDRAALRHGTYVTVSVTGTTGAAGNAVPARRGATFQDVAPGDLVVLVDSAGRAAVAVGNGSAASRLAVRVGARVRVASAP